MSAFKPNDAENTVVDSDLMDTWKVGMGKVSEQRALSHLVYRSHIIPFHDKWCCEFPRPYPHNYSFLLLKSQNE